MKTLLEAIKKHPQAFIDALEKRINTTQCDVNRENHSYILHFIETEDWLNVGGILTREDYQQALGGVVFCLDINFSDKSKIIKLFNEGLLS